MTGMGYDGAFLGKVPKEIEGLGLFWDQIRSKDEKYIHHICVWKWCGDCISKVSMCYNDVKWKLTELDDV